MTPRLPIWATAVASYRDALRATSSLWKAAIVFAALSFILQITQTIILSELAPRIGGQWLLAIPFSVVGTCLATPWAIAVHRHILLDEVSSYALDPSDARLRRFLGTWLVIFLGGQAPSLATGAFAAAPLVGAAIAVPLTIAVLILAVRTLILFPAIAIDAPGASWGNAWADSAGSFWSIARISFLITLPILVIGQVLVVAMGMKFVVGAMQTPGPTPLGWLLFGALITPPSTALLVALASNLYRVLADRLTTAPNEP